MDDSDKIKLQEQKTNDIQSRLSDKDLEISDFISIMKELVKRLKANNALTTQDVYALKTLAIKISLESDDTV